MALAFKFIVYAALASLAYVRIADATAPVVDLGYAQYQGVSNSTLNITSFLGMRYAAAPTARN
ncbi:Carboxylic ester hydrolase [Mycena sanguinolenta]|uniref:Carboxylic ester hydrolase n=1 Tax=Mycena sanguinolenta TaxID=230812 RepID=A0A8H6XU40_9AGAR|nr:Carboxylic ester hydrolase [Mycena sanguinolenta]